MLVFVLIGLTAAIAYRASKKANELSDTKADQVFCFPCFLVKASSRSKVTFFPFTKSRISLSQKSLVKIS